MPRFVLRSLLTVVFLLVPFVASSGLGAYAGGTLRYRSRQHRLCLRKQRRHHLRELSDRRSAGSTRVWTPCPISAHVLAADRTPFLSQPAPGTPASAASASSIPLLDLPPADQPAPPAAAPTDTIAPSIGGPTLVGDKLSASNAGGTSLAMSSLTALVPSAGPPPPPANTTPLTISGTAIEETPIEEQTLSAIAGPATPQPPTASFTYSPSSPVTGKPVTFNGTSSTCSDGPCTYEWSDDGSPTRPITPLWPLGNGQTISFTFLEADTKYVRLVVTDASGQTATVEHNVAVGTSEPPPPPPPAPANTAPPNVSGSAVEGQTLTASSGTWSGNPTSYAYQWQDCGVSGGGCSNLSGATASSHTLDAAEVGKTVRVVVTATNADGSTSATSATAGPVASQPPTASFTYSPSSPVTGKPVTFNGTSSTCSDGPCTYEWSDDGSPTRPITPLWPLGNGQTLSFTFLEADTKYVRLVVTDASGQTATVEHNVAVGTSEPPPPPPPAPANTAPPSVSGSAVEGQTLTASSGTWSGSPTSYAYQWEDCDTAPASCSHIAGATASTRVLSSGDVGHTLRVVVKATNAGGTGEATSEATAAVTAKQKETTPENCFANPEGCGYPGTKDTGVESCSSLPKSSGTKTITKAETIENTDITGYVVIDASGVTLNHDCVLFNGGEAEGSAAVVLESAASSFTISNTTVRAENTTSDSFEEAIRNNHSDPGAVASKDRLEDCAECIHQLWAIDESYVIANGRAAASGVHTEDWWFDNNTITANDDTLLNPSKQTAVIFAEGSGACENHEQVRNSLIAGGGFMFYFCTHASSIGKSTIEIKDNRFARRTCTKAIIEDVEGRGGWECSGKPNEEESYFDAGEGAGGYYPRGGFFGVASESPETFPSYGGTGWEGNYWDDDLQAQADETR